MIRSLLTVLLVIVLLALLGVLSWMLVLYLDWPIWGAFAVFFGVLALYFASKAAKRFFIISRTRSRLLAAQRAEAMKSAQNVDFKYALNKQIKNALALLKGSQLRRFGNPLYVLPWYLVMGESGSGKTTAISRSRLMPMMRQVEQGKDVVQTTNCDWWFFSEAVVIDTAGRYVSPDGNELDQKEWDYLLELFAKHRSREAINGLVVVIDAPVLLSEDVQTIEQRGQALRDRIDQLMRLFEKRVPIYVMVTKSDQIYGFTSWANSLSDAESMQAMGYMHDEATDLADEQQFARQAIDTLCARLESLRLDLSMRDVDITPEIMLFPGELARLKTGLQLFLKATFGANPYLEHPFLRGLFLTSARQQPALPSRLGDLIERPSLEGRGAAKSKGLFIHDLFARILPVERAIALPGQIVSRWRQVTANLALVAWFSLCLAALVFLVVSYQSTSSTIDRLNANIPPGFLAEPTADEKLDIDALNSALVFVKLILQEEHNWRTRWLAFSPAVDRLEDKLKASYVRQFRRLQDTQSDGPLDVKKLLSSTSGQQRAYGILSLTRYINMVQARVNGSSYGELLAMPQVPISVLKSVAPEMDVNTLSGFDELLAAAVGWSNPEDPYLTDVLVRDRAELAATLSASEHLSWLVDWADTLPNAPSIALADFWNPGVVTKSGYQIRGGLTLSGQTAINGFIDELDQAMLRSALFKRKIDTFRSWYLTQRFTAWKGMASDIMQGAAVVPTEPQYRRVVASIGTENSPFQLFLDKLLSEFQSLPSKDSPSWLEFARYYVNLTAQASENRTSALHGSLNTISAINNAAGPAMRASVSQGQNLIPSAITQARNDINLLEAYIKARDKAVVDVLGGTLAAMNMASGYFGQSDAQGSAPGEGVLRAMRDAMAEFRKNSQFDTAQDDVIWQVILAPMQTLDHYAFEQASCNLQDAWSRDVMWKTQLAITPQEVSEQLFGDKGSVWTFVDGPAKPFVNRLGGAFVPAEIDGVQFPFASGFVQFLNQAVSSRVSEVVRQKLAEVSTKKSAKLTLAANPLSVNPGAKAQPYAALLFVQCDQKPIELSNVNMQASDSFEWTPGKCGETRLEIEIENMTLIKRYPGPTGLATFLEEFSDGARVFTPADFPAAMKQLDELDVREITVRYEMSGRQEVLDLAKDYEFVMQQTTPSTQPAVSRLVIDVPQRAGRCWTGPSSPPTEALSVPRLIQQQAEKKANPPPKPPEPPLPPVKPLKPVPTQEVTVEKGQTLFSIAKQYRVDLQILKSLNDLKNDTILIGQKLLVPIWQNQGGN